MSLSKAIKRKYRKVSLDRFYRKIDLEHKNLSEKAIFNILKTLPENSLSTKTEKEIESYAFHELGSKSYAPMLKAYAVFHGEFREGLIPNNYYQRYVLPQINGEFRIMSKARHWTRRIIQSDEIPDLAYYISGNWISLDRNVLTPNQARNYFFAESDRVIVKINDSMRGKGFFLLKEEEFENFQFGKYSGLVVQRPIEQHPWFSKFCPDNTVTIRVTTIKEYAKPAKSLGNFIRIGRMGEEQVQQFSRVVVGLSSDGALTKYGMNMDFQVNDRHPDTQIIWEGEIIPEYAKIISRCEELHDLEPTLGVIGWDVVLDKNNQIKIMEWNTFHPGILDSEMLNGPHFTETNWASLWLKSSNK